MRTTLNSDYLIESLRQRVMEKSDWDKFCEACGVVLTAADREAQECTNCHASLVEDESVDEDLVEDEEYDWYNANGMFDDDD